MGVGDSEVDRKRSIDGVVEPDVNFIDVNTLCVEGVCLLVDKYLVDGGFGDADGDWFNNSIINIGWRVDDGFRLTNGTNDVKVCCRDGRVLVAGCGDFVDFGLVDKIFEDNSKVEGESSVAIGLEEDLESVTTSCVDDCVETSDGDNNVERSWVENNAGGVGEREFGNKVDKAELVDDCVSGEDVGAIVVNILNKDDVDCVNGGRDVNLDEAFDDSCVVIWTDVFTGEVVNKASTVVGKFTFVVSADVEDDTVDGEVVMTDVLSCGGDSEDDDGDMSKAAFGVICGAAISLSLIPGDFTMAGIALTLYFLTTYIVCFSVSSTKGSTIPTEGMMSSQNKGSPFCWISLSKNMCRGSWIEFFCSSVRSGSLSKVPWGSDVIKTA